MPGPESADPETKVDPLAPKDPHPADTTDPGEMGEIKQLQRETKTGKYGEQKAKTYKPDSDENKDKTHWIEVMLVDEAGDPVPGAALEIEVPGGDMWYGSTDEKGLARVDNIDSGDCKITFQ